MIRVTIAFNAPNEEVLRRAMDEIHGAYASVADEAKNYERIGGQKLCELAKRKLAVAAVLDDIADAIDTAKPEKVR